MKRTNGHIGIVLLLAAGLLAGCAGSGDEPTAGGGESPKEIRLTPNVWRVMDGAAARQQGGTRATTFDNPTALQTEASFKCSAYEAGTTTGYFTGANVAWNDRISDDWAFTTAKYWPAPVSNAVPAVYPFDLDFFAYMPATPPAYITAVTYTTARSPQFTCNMTQTIDKEFIWALTTAQNKDSNSGTVDLDFKHPFARINFTLSPASGTHVTINSISIDGSNFYTTGTCTFDGSASTWSDKGGSASLGSFSVNVPYLVIPNNYGSKTITVNATWDDWSDVTKNVTSGAVTINWQPGYSYTYTLTLREETLIVETTKYTEQW